MHRLKDYLPEELIHGGSNPQDIADAMGVVFQKRYTLQAPIWAELHKIKRAIDIFLDNDENKEQANTAVKRLIKKAGTESIIVAGCTMVADHLNTAGYNYDDSDDPTLTAIYEVKDVVHKLETDREEWLRTANTGDKAENFGLTLSQEATDFFVLKKKPGKKAYKGVNVRMPAQPL